MRSQHWYAGDDRDAFIHRAWMRRGLPDHAFDGRPQIVICNTWSDLTPCNGHLREIAEHVERGWEQLYREHVEQADRGAGLDFLAGVRGSAVARESH
jgi:dihydroxyacid dehydratase/phosphogluconate dehydratase